MSKEEKLIIKILFKKEDLKKNDFCKINFENLIKIASSHLMLPALYINLKNKKSLSNIPKDLAYYLKEIYSLNRSRNEVIISEANEIALKFKNQKIDYIFLKGTSMLLGNYYKNIGERMIGDIDILVADKDFRKAINILKEMKYFNKNSTKISLSNHFPRLLHNKKMIAVEIHKEILHFRAEKINKQEILNQKVRLNNNKFIPNNYFQIIHNVYNYQLNDHGYLKATYSFRSIYDILKIIKENTHFFDKKYDKIIRCYFIVLDYILKTHFILVL